MEARRFATSCSGFNHNIFKNPEALMQNVERVTAHLARLLPMSRIGAGARCG